MKRTRAIRQHRPAAPRGSRSVDFGSMIRTRALPGEAGVLVNAYEQHPWAHGALRVAGQMLGSVPFVMVKANPAAEALRAQIASAASAGDLALCEAKLRLLRRESPLRARDAALRTRAVQEPVTRVPGSPFQPLFDRVNPTTARAEMVLAYVVYMLHDGNALIVWRKEDGTRLTSEKEMPGQLWLLPRAGWEPVIHQGEVAGWEHTIKGEKTEYKPHEITHLRMFSMGTGVWGFGPLNAARLQLEQDQMAGAWNKSFFESGADPGVIFKIPKDANVSDAQIAAVLRKWSDRHAGAKKAGRPAAVPEGWDLERHPVTHRDMEFGALLDKNRDAMLAALTLHKAVLGVTDEINYATMQAARRMVWSNLLGPLASYFEDRLFTTLFSRFDGGNVYGIFDLSGVSELQEEIGEKVTAAKGLTDMGVPFNDAASLLNLGLPSYDWGDQGYVFGGKVPVEQQGDPVESEFDSVADSEKPDDKEKSKDDAGRARVQPYRLDAQRRDWWRGWWRKVGHNPERALLASLRRYWYELRGEQLARFEKIRAVRAGGDDPFTEEDVNRVLFDGKPWEARLVKIHEPRWEEAAEQSLEALAKEITVTAFGLSDPAWERFLESKRIKVRDVTKRAREHIREVMMMAVHDGKSVNEAADMIRVTFNGLQEPARRLRIARTEIAQAANGARFLAMKASGVSLVSWVTAADDVVRDSHAEFERLGPVQMGSNFLDLINEPGTLQTPGDPRGPAEEIINCRCTLVAEEALPV